MLDAGGLDLYSAWPRPQMNAPSGIVRGKFRCDTFRPERRSDAAAFQRLCELGLKKGFKNHATPVQGRCCPRCCCAHLPRRYHPAAWQRSWRPFPALYIRVATKTNLWERTRRHTLKSICHSFILELNIGVRVILAWGASLCKYIVCLPRICAGRRSTRHRGARRPHLNASWLAI